MRFVHHGSVSEGITSLTLNAGDLPYGTYVLRLPKISKSFQKKLLNNCLNFK